MDKIINRRFVRIKALQALYAFYINKQANYQLALAALNDAFQPDVFAAIPIPASQLAKNKEKAIEIFKTWVQAQKALPSPIEPSEEAIQKALDATWRTYQQLLNHDNQQLEKSWEKTHIDLQKSCLSILQLMLEWLSIAQEQINYIPFLPQQSQEPSLTILITQDPLLTTLQHDPDLKKRIEAYQVSWKDHDYTVKNWYNQFIQQRPPSPQQAADPNPHLPPSSQLIPYLLETIIFKQAAIQTFFNNIDLYWSTHKPIIQKLFKSLHNPSEINTILAQIEQLFQPDNQLSFFYRRLTHTVLSKEQAIEQCIRQTSENWSTERILCLDYILIKLALTEICYMDDIPTNVSINEYIEIAKQYSSPKSTTFINGILDKIAKTS